MFFVFADTVATRSHGRPENGHGWMGVRFQAHPHDLPSEIILHAHLLDANALHEKEALGILGVNLLHGAFYQRETPERLIGLLVDGLSRARIEIDMISFAGPAFAGIDNRLMALQLVEHGLTDAAMFRVQRRRHEPDAGPARPVRVHLRPRCAGEDHCRAQGVRPRRHPHAPLRG